MPPATLGTAAQLAAVLGIPRSTIERYGATGQLTSYGMARRRLYDPREVLAVRERNRRGVRSHPCPSAISA